jgi:malonyl-CoA O-methyltransferase
MLKATYANFPFLKKLISKPRLVCADIEHLPIASNSVDILWSNLAIQWCNDLDQAFLEAKRVLRPNGLLMFSTFGPDTLKELRVASQNGHTHVSRFIDMHDIGDALTRSGFSAPVLDVEHYTLTYDDVKGVMRDLKAIGAHNATEGRARGLLGRGFLQQLTQQYEQFRQNGKLPATYEVVFGHAWKSDKAETLSHDFVPIHFKSR